MKKFEFYKNQESNLKKMVVIVPLLFFLGYVGLNLFFIIKFNDSITKTNERVVFGIKVFFFLIIFMYILYKFMNPYFIVSLGEDKIEIKNKIYYFSEYNIKCNLEERDLRTKSNSIKIELESKRSQHKKIYKFIYFATIGGNEDEEIKKLFIEIKKIELL